MPFVKKPKPSESVPTDGSSTAAPTAPVKGLSYWQREAARRRKRHGEILHQLDLSQQALAQLLSQTVIDDEIDATQIADSVLVAEGKIKAWEAAEKIAQQQVEAAERELKKSALAISLDQEGEALKHLAAVARRGEPILDKLELWVRTELSPALAEAHAAVAICGRSEGQTAFLHAFRDAFVLCAVRSCAPYIPDGRVNLPAFRDRRLSSWLDTDFFPTRPE